MTVGEKIQFYRKQKGLSQEELGKLLIVSRQTVSQWENGQTYPTVDNLMRLREVFGITMDDLVKEGEPALPETVEEVPLETLRFEETHEDVACIRNSFLAACKKIFCAAYLPLIISCLLCCVLFIWLKGASSGIVLGILMFCIAGYLIYRWNSDWQRSIKTMDRIGSQMSEHNLTVVSLYADRLSFRVYRDGVEHTVRFARYKDIKRAQETETYYALECSPFTLFIPKKEVMPSSMLQSLLVDKIREYQKTGYTISQMLWNTRIYSLGYMIGLPWIFLLPDLVKHFSIPRAIYWLDAVVMAYFLAAAGYILYRRLKGKQIIRTTLFAMIIAFLLLLGERVAMGTWMELFAPEPIVYSSDTEYIQRAEELAGMDFPEEYFLTLESVNSQYNDEYIYWNALLEYWDAEQITRLVHEDSRWIDSQSSEMVTRVPGWEPGDEDIWDLFAVYNIDTDEWNTVPDDEETYHYIAFLWYQSGEMLLIIEYEK